MVLIGALFVSNVQNAFAGVSNTIPKYGFLGGTAAFANVTSVQSGGGSSGMCTIRSYTSPATTINVIGWTWWQCNVFDSGGNWLFGSNFGGSASTASSKNAAVNMLGASSASGRQP